MTHQELISKSFSVFLMMSLGLSALVACAPKNPSLPKNRFTATTGTQGIEPGFIMRPAQALSLAPEVLKGEEMAKIILIGARAVEWVDLLQANIRVEKREQIWRRQDRIGKEPTPDQPSRYNPDTIQDLFDEGLKRLPKASKAVLISENSLPSNVPGGLTVTDLMPGLKILFKAYQGASRWVAFYPVRNYLNKDERDFRPWLSLQAKKSNFEALARDWKHLSIAARTSWAESVAEACIISSLNPDDCILMGKKAIEEENPEPVLTWLTPVFNHGEREYQARFQVVRPHLGATVSENNQGMLTIDYPSFGVSTDLLTWMMGLVAQGWSSDKFNQTIRSVSKNLKGAIKVVFEKGALPHVNGPGGDTITLDANQKIWQELTQVAMIHEFGHVMGFPDCNVEFWEPDESPFQGSFIFYALDPTDRMCALSGETLDHHRAAMRTAYRP